MKAFMWIVVYCLLVTSDYFLVIYQTFFFNVY